MQKLYVKIAEPIVPLLEEHFCETGEVEWVVEKKTDNTPPELFGYFEDGDCARKAYIQLRAAFPELPEEFVLTTVEDRDWKEEYKKFLTAWNCGGLHWVPVWMRDTYVVPPADKVFYFDAGLAFGTGDHPTTRMCMLAIIKYLRENNGADKFLIDAGCGSGILSLSAKLMGFGRVFGFDRDPEAIRASLANAKLNGINLDGVEFAHDGIEKSLSGREADILVANIQADVLRIYAENIIGAVRGGGTLVLSGILLSESDEVRKYFEAKAAERLVSSNGSSMGDWFCLEMVLR